MLDKFNEQVLKTLAGEITENEQEPYILPSSLLRNVQAPPWTDPRGQQEMMRNQYNPYTSTPTQDAAKNAAVRKQAQKQSVLGFFSKLGRKLFNA